MVSLLGFSSVLAVGLAMMGSPLPAQALTSLDGSWTVVHGGTGQLSHNANGTNTSTCRVPWVRRRLVPGPLRQLPTGLERLRGLPR